MSILGRLALLFVVVPLLELALLILMGQWVGTWPTISLVVFTGVTGAWLARTEGLRTMWRLRHDLAKGRVPGQAIMDGMAVLAGGALLLTPGILTDLVGFSLLVPRTRRVIQKRIMARLERRIQEGAVQVKVAGGQMWARPSGVTPSDVMPTDVMPSDVMPSEVMSSDPMSPGPMSPDPVSRDPMSSSRSAGE